MVNRGNPDWIKRIRRSSVPEAELSETNCPVCEQSPRRKLIVERGYPLWKCLSCKHVYISPRPSEKWLSELYSSTYLPDTNTEEVWEQSEDDIFEATARAIHRYHPGGGDLLDVGAGFGGFLIRAERDGWKLHGIEPNSSAVAAAQKRLGARAQLQQSIFEDADLEPCSYDGIIMMNVIEHVREPRAVCRKAYELLRPGGFLGLRWPQVSRRTLLRERLRRNHETDRAVIGAPIHLHDYSRSSMERLMATSGFCDVVHAWSGTRHFPNMKPGNHLLVSLLTAMAKYSHSLSGGRIITPFIARLSLGKKPSAANS